MMNCLQKKKIAFMSIVNSVKGFVRTVTGVLPLTLANCVDEDSIIDYTLYGESVQEGTPTPETPVEVESVGEKSKNLFSPDVPYEQGFLKASGNGIIKNKDFPHIQVFTIAVKPNTTYSYNGVIMNNTTYALLNSNMEYLGKYGANISSKQNITFETTSDTAYVQICSSLMYFQNGTLYLNEGEQYIEEPYYEGYKIPIKVSGKNLCNPDEIVTNGRKETDYVYGSDIDIWVKAGTYRITFDYGGAIGPEIYFRKGQVSSGYLGSFKTQNQKSAKYTFTFTEDGYLRISHFGNKDTAYFYDFMLVKGTTATDYEPYHEPITTNIYLDEPLRKVGDYADYVDLENGKVVRNVGKYTFTGAEADMGGTNIDASSFGYTINLPALSLSSEKVGLCNYLKKEALATYNTNRFAYHNIANHPYVYIFFKNTDFPELEAYSPTTAKQVVKQMYDSGVPMVLYYNRNKPTETPISLPTIPTFKGTSIITADTTIQPSNAEITYYSTAKE